MTRSRARRMSPSPLTPSSKCTPATSARHLASTRGPTSGRRGPDARGVPSGSFLRRVADYDPARPVRPWLFGFAFRVASRFRRRAYRRHEVPTASETATDPTPSAAEEREALAIQALVIDGQPGTARERAARFRAAWPDSLLLPAVADESLVDSVTTKSAPAQYMAEGPRCARERRDGLPQFSSCCSRRHARRKWLTSGGVQRVHGRRRSTKLASHAPRRSGTTEAHTSRRRRTCVDRPTVRDWGRPQWPKSLRAVVGVWMRRGNGGGLSARRRRHLRVRFRPTISTISSRRRTRAEPERLRGRGCLGVAGAGRIPDPSNGCEWRRDARASRDVRRTPEAAAVRADFHRLRTGGTRTFSRRRVRPHLRAPDELRRPRSLRQNAGPVGVVRGHRNVPTERAAVVGVRWDRHIRLNMDNAGRRRPGKRRCGVFQSGSFSLGSNTTTWTTYEDGGVSRYTYDGLPSVDECGQAMIPSPTVTCSRPDMCTMDVAASQILSEAIERALGDHAARMPLGRLLLGEGQHERLARPHRLSDENASRGHAVAEGLDAGIRADVRTTRIGGRQRA